MCKLVVALLAFLAMTGLASARHNIRPAAIYCDTQAEVQSIIDANVNDGFMAGVARFRVLYENKGKVMRACILTAFPRSIRVTMLGKVAETKDFQLPDGQKTVAAIFRVRFGTDYIQYMLVFILPRPSRQA